ncbi:MAG: hypothetical protein ACK5ZC_11075 [Pirellulaceae bacterium]
MVSGQWSVVSGQWSVVSGQWSVVSGQVSEVGGGDFLGPMDFRYALSRGASSSMSGFRTATCSCSSSLRL